MPIPDKATAEELDKFLPKRPCHACAGKLFWQELRWPDSLICQGCWPSEVKRETRGEARTVNYSGSPAPVAPKKKPSKKHSVDDLWKE